MIQFIKRFNFWFSADRIGPDIPTTHWMLFFKQSMKSLCRKKFNSFHETAEVRPYSYIVNCSKILLGENVVIRPNSMLFASKNASITIRDNAMLGSGVHIYVHNHSFGQINVPIIDQGYSSSEDVLVDSGSWIGANSIILSGVTIGKNSVVAANSVVSNDVPDHCLVAGNPAIIIRNFRN